MGLDFRLREGRVLVTEVEAGGPAETAGCRPGWVLVKIRTQPVDDVLASLLCAELFVRFPRLRVATIESGSSWVPGLLAKLEKAYGQMPFAFKADPVEQFRQHVWVSPYYEDDLERLKQTIGADHILFGSDYPHGEGLADPVSFVNDLPGFSKDDVQLIMRDNGLGLVQRRPR